MLPYVFFCYHPMPYDKESFEKILNQLINVTAIHYFQNNDDVVHVMENHRDIQIFTEYPKYNQKRLILLLAGDVSSDEYFDFKKFGHCISLDSTLNKNIVDLFAPALYMEEVFKIVNSSENETNKVKITEVSHQEIMTKSNHPAINDQNFYLSFYAYQQFWLKLKFEKLERKSFQYTYSEIFDSFKNEFETMKNEVFFYQHLTKSNKAKIDTFYGDLNPTQRQTCTSTEQVTFPFNLDYDQKE